MAIQDVFGRQGLARENSGPATYDYTALPESGIDPKRAREITGLLRQLQSALEKSALLERVRALESELRRYKRKAGER